MRILPAKSAVILMLTAVLVSDVQAQRHYVYTNDGINGNNTVSAFAVGSNGALTEISGSPFPTGGSAFSTTFASNHLIVTGSVLYAVNSNSNSVSGFSIDPETGGLTAVPGSPFPVEGISFGVSLSITATPDGRFLIASHAVANKIMVFAIAPTGELLPSSSIPYLLSGHPFNLKISPLGDFLAAATEGGIGGGTMMYSINSEGLLTEVPGSPFPDGTAGLISGLDIDCTGKLLFGSQATAGSPPSVGVYGISSTGTPIQIPGSPFTSSGGRDSSVCLLSPNNQYLFVSNQQSDTITVFKVGPDGVLSVVPGSPFPTGDTTPVGMATNRAGTLLFVANSGRFPSSSVSVFSVSQTGTLAQVPGSPFMGARSSHIHSVAAYPPSVCTVSINGATLVGKKLFVTGENFDSGARILIDGEEQKTKNDGQDWTSLLIAKKGGKRIKTGRTVTLQVRNSRGGLSNEFRFTRSATSAQLADLY